VSAATAPDVVGSDQVETEAVQEEEDGQQTLSPEGVWSPEGARPGAVPRVPPPTGIPPGTSLRPGIVIATPAGGHPPVPPEQSWRTPDEQRHDGRPFHGSRAVEAGATVRVKVTNGAQ
jgi:hypothetical protein